MADVIERMGNPFLDEFSELVALGSRYCMVEETCSLKKHGITIMQSVVKDRSIAINNVIKKSSLSLVVNNLRTNKSKQKKTITALRNNVACFVLVKIEKEGRDSDLLEFFCHEVQPFPPPLSELGNLRQPNVNSDQLKCIKRPQQLESDGL